MGKRLKTQRRGRGYGKYISPSHMKLTDVKYPRVKESKGVVLDIIKERGRIAPIAVVKFGSENSLMLASEGLTVDQEVMISPTAPIERGNCLPVSKMPEGTLIHNIELKPGDGGKMVRAAGNAATVVSHGKRTVIQLPSGKFKELHPDCRATVGVVAGGGHAEKPFAKSGKKYHAFKSKSRAYFSVSGVAMNPVDHPHGGGAHQHVGTQSSVSRHAPPGRKVGHISPKAKRKRRRK